MPSTEFTDVLALYDTNMGRGQSTIMKCCQDTTENQLADVSYLISLYSCEI